jgi:myo-inositol-1(or 4)-monophosphatase
VILVEEAGGKITDLDGKPYQLGGTSILATNGHVHDEMLQLAAEIASRKTLSLP